MGVINVATNFLLHPQVTLSPLEKRKAFLRSKKLTETEILLAIEKADASRSLCSNEVAATTTNRQEEQAPPVPPRPAEESSDWKDWLLSATAIGAAGWIASSLIQVLNLLFSLDNCRPTLGEGSSGTDSIRIWECTTTAC